MDLEDNRELMRQGKDGGAAGLPPEPFLAVGIGGAAPNAAVSRRRLLDQDITTRTSANLERSGLFQTVSDLHFSPALTRFLPKPFSPGALMIILAAPWVSSFVGAYPQSENTRGLLGEKTMVTANSA
ncbi:MAG TPA: hypothetical protein VGD57_08690 [Candidatus Dormibacteraeota bacterium]